MLKDQCEGNFIKNFGIKDCTNCLVPHSKGSYEKIMSKMKLVLDNGSDF
jgi:Zn-finger protein